jgi:hypothetical protein
MPIYTMTMKPLLLLESQKENIHGKIRSPQTTTLENEELDECAFGVLLARSFFLIVEIGSVGGCEIALLHPFVMLMETKTWSEDVTRLLLPID